MNSALFHKIMRSNIRQYRLFVMCNTALVMICYFFGGIYFNELFTSDRYVDSMISSNIIAPTVVVFAFAVFFIPYTHFQFNLQNERKYGIMEATGVSWSDLRNYVLMENAMLAVSSLILGLSGGMILQILFFKVFVKRIEIEIDFTAISINGLIQTSAALLAIYALSIIVIMVRLSRITVKEMIDDSKKVRIGRSSSIILLLTGFAAVGYSLIGVFFVFNQSDTNKLILYYVVMLVGIYLMISNSYVLLIWLKKHIPNVFYKNLPVIGSIRQNFSTNKRIIFFSICLISFVVFFQTFSVYCSKLMVRNAINDNPYHIAYVEYEEESFPTEEEIVQFASAADVAITKNDVIPIILDSSIIIPQSASNEYLGTDYEIGNKECVIYTQYDLHDGYPHDEFKDDTVAVNGSEELSVKEVSYSSLINNGITSRNIVIVNDQKFNEIEQINDSSYLAAIRVINCETINQSEALYKEISKHYDMGLDGIFASAQCMDLKTADQSGMFLILISVIMNMLLLSLNAVMVYFKLQSNRDYNEKKYDMLWKIGISDSEILKLQKTENSIVFVMPAVVAVCVGTLMTIGLIKITM